MKFNFKVYKDYTVHIFKRKYIVAIECFKLGLWTRAITHDLEKFYPDVFFPMAEHYFGKGDNKGKFEEALDRHRTRVSYRPEHWVKYEPVENTSDEVSYVWKAYQMPLKDMLEYVAVLKAMENIPGYEDAMKYFKESKEIGKFKFHPVTKNLLSGFLNLEQLDYEYNLSKGYFDV